MGVYFNVFIPLPPPSTGLRGQLRRSCFGSVIARSQARAAVVIRLTSVAFGEKLATAQPVVKIIGHYFRSTISAPSSVSNQQVPPPTRRVARARNTRR